MIITGQDINSHTEPHALTPVGILHMNQRLIMGNVLDELDHPRNAGGFIYDVIKMPRGVFAGQQTAIYSAEGKSVL